MEIKLPSSGLLLIVLSLWRLIQLATGNFAYSAFNTLSLKFSPRTLLALFTATTLAIPGLRIRLSMVLLLQEGISGSPFYVIPSRLGVLDLVGGRVHLNDSELHRKIPCTAQPYLQFLTSLLAKETDSWPTCHEFESSTSEDPRCRESMYVKYVEVETSSSHCVVWKLGEGSASSDVVFVTRTGSKLRGPSAKALE
ncbi:hypothetical protein TNCV_3430221 [Trichonephila clavipes]|nr:hypothetical protein TNCV_3430221 [Trichonephila clavipes]